jgi:phage FluMu protein Com
MANKYDKFRRGRSTFKCTSCGRLTREAGDNAYTDCCPQCYELAGFDNMFNDDGRKPTEAELKECNGLLAAIIAKGGDGASVKGGCGYIWTDEVVS